MSAKNTRVDTRAHVLGTLREMAKMQGIVSIDTVVRLRMRFCARVVACHRQGNEVKTPRNTELGEMERKRLQFAAAGCNKSAYSRAQAPR